MKGRSEFFRRLSRVMRVAEICETQGIPTREGLERARTALDTALRRVPRRQFMTEAGGAAAAGLVGSALGPAAPLVAAASVHDVAIVGAGLAGLACADHLRRRHGIRATVYEAADRVGGRCWSLGGAFRGPVEFPGQVIERGGELVDNLHKTLLGYAQEFGLAREDVNRGPGETFFYFDAARVSEAAIVDEYRALVPALRADLRTLSGVPTADRHTAADEVLDRTDLADYLRTRGAGRLILKTLETAYTIEYGREPAEQSALNLLLFIHADRRSRFQPFGVFSDERFHIVGGNQQIPEGLAARLPGQIRLGLVLTRIARLSDGRIELTFSQSRGPAVTVAHDVVVLTLPFSVLRQVRFHRSLELPWWKVQVIEGLGYGTNTKLMVGFDGRPWREQGGNGVCYTDLANLQNTWETNPSLASAARGVLTDYTGGLLGARLDPSRLQRDTANFLADLDLVYPGIAGRARRNARGDVLAHMEHWSSNPFALGSYTCNQPGYFTTMAGREATPVGNLYFAGEHTDPFEEWQGFMEGAANSGIRAATEVAARARL